MMRLYSMALLCGYLLLSLSCDTDSTPGTTEGSVLNGQTCSPMSQVCARWEYRPWHVDQACQKSCIARCAGLFGIGKTGVIQKAGKSLTTWLPATLTNVLMEIGRPVVGVCAAELAVSAGSSAIAKLVSGQSNAPSLCSVPCAVPDGSVCAEWQCPNQ